MRLLVTVMACILAAGLAPPALMAQADSGRISGVVVDARREAMPNTTIVLENVQTGQEVRVNTDTQGRYVFQNVAPGRYRLRMSVGQNAVPSQEFEVAGNRAQTIDLSYTGTSGAPATDGLVVAEPEILELHNAQLWQTYNRMYVEFLPQPVSIDVNTNLYGGYNATVLQEGVTAGGVGEGLGPATAGTRPIHNNFHVNGIDNNNVAGSGPLVNVSPEATMETSIYRGQPEPVFGQSIGGQFNSIIRSGANEFHGAVYDYLQNRNLNAMEQALVRPGMDEEGWRYDQNRVGGSAGFPIIPDKLFMFGNFEYIPMGFTRPLAQSALAPTTAGIGLLNGISGVSQANLDLLRNLNVGTATSTTTVGGTSIPVGPVNNLVNGFRNQWYGTGAVDWVMSDRSQLRSRYVHNRIESSNLTGSNLAGAESMFEKTALMASVSHYYNFTPSVTNELRLGYNRLDSDNSFTGSLAGFSSFPNISILGSSNLALGPDVRGPQFAINNTYHLSDDLSWLTGRHNFRFGFDGRRHIGNIGAPASFAGNFVYSGLSQFLTDLPPDVLAQRSFGANAIDNGQWMLFGYIHDTWRARPNLAINLGVRYQYSTIPQFALGGRFAGLGTVNGIDFDAEPETQKTLFAPNVGFAWSPMGNRKMVVRSGFSMQYAAMNPYGSLFSDPFTSLFGSTVIGQFGQNPASGFLAGGGLDDPSGLNAGVPTQQQARSLTTSHFGDQELPYTMNWNFALQHELWNSASISAEYIGTRGVHMPVFGYLNQQSAVTANNSLPIFNETPSASAIANQTLTLNQLQAIPTNSLGAEGFANPIATIRNDGNTWYHGLGVKFNQRFSRAFQGLIGYTWSHMIADSSGTFLDTLNPGRERFSSIYDRRHRVTATGLMDLAPLFDQRGRVLAGIFANMTLSGTYSYQTPQQLPIVTAGDAGLTGLGFASAIANNANGAGTSMLNPVRNASGAVVGYTAANPNAQYLAAAPGVFSSGFANRFELDNLNNIDVSLVKRFAFRDRFGIEVRGDAYNLANHSQFIGSPVNNIQWGSLGMLPSSFIVAGTPVFESPDDTLLSNARTIQLALRFTW